MRLKQHYVLALASALLSSTFAAPSPAVQQAKRNVQTVRAPGRSGSIATQCHLQ